MRDLVKRILPGSLRNPASSLYWWWINRGSHQFAGVVSPRLKRSRKRLRSFKDLHRGERCFILGNGPSLKDTDLSLLREEYTFGMNRIYLLFPELGFTTTYFLAVNTLVIEQCSGDINSLSIPKFLTWRGREWIDDGPNNHFLDTDYTAPATFTGDLTGRVFEGSTVTYVAMQVAYYLGFEEVILIGVDHSFQSKGEPNTTITSQGGDTDHFSPDYFGKGFRWQLPDLEASEVAYRMADEAYRRHGRRILDATIGGKLTIFPKVEYAKLFNPCMSESG